MSASPHKDLITNNTANTTTTTTTIETAVDTAATCDLPSTTTSTTTVITTQRTHHPSPEQVGFARNQDQHGYPPKDDDDDEEEGEEHSGLHEENDSPQPLSMMADTTTTHHHSSDDGEEIDTGSFPQEATMTTTTTMPLVDGFSSPPPPPPVPAPDDDSNEAALAEQVLEAAMDGYVPPPLPPPAKRQKLGDVESSSQKTMHKEQWDHMWERLKEYKTDHGHCLVPKRYVQDPKLGTWVETQRVQYKRLDRVLDPATGQEQVQPNKRLTAERLQKLQDIGFAWCAKHVRKNTQLLNNGSSSGEGSGVEPPLAAAAAATNATTTTSLSSSRSSPSPPLESEPSTTRRSSTPTRLKDAQWDELYHRLVLFHTEHGHALVPRKYPSDPRLATWVETQRVLWNKDLKSPPNTPPPKQRLTVERKAKLDALGFCWSLRNKRIDDHWDGMFRQLVEYKTQHGDCLVPSRYEANVKLGKWVETQRYEYTKLQRMATPIEESEPPTTNGTQRPINPRLTEERLHRLESIGFEWKVKHKMKRYYDKLWDQMFGRLLAFKEQNGHVMVPKRYPPDMKLGTWVHTQRIQYRKLIMGQNQTKKMDTTTNEEDAGTTTMVATTTDVAASHPPTSAEEGETTNFRLTQERRLRLEAVGFVWSARGDGSGDQHESAATTTTTTTTLLARNSYDDQWDQMLERLIQYKEQHGDCKVPKRYKQDPKLGTWVDTQRVQFKKMQKKLAEQGQQYVLGSSSSTTDPIVMSNPKPLVGRLTDDRIQRLHRLGFVWSLRDDWQKHYEELKVYKEQHGNCNVPARYDANRRLGIWVSAQRQQYKILLQQPPSTKPEDVSTNPSSTKSKRSAPLTQERIDLLNTIGFTWTIRSRDSLGESWNQRLEELKAFKAQHGHCMVPSRYESNPELGIWVGTQRTQFRLFLRSKELSGKVATTPSATSMTEERIRELDALGFVWAMRGSGGGGGGVGDVALTPPPPSHDVEMMQDAVEAAEAAAQAVEAAEKVGAMEYVVAQI